MTPRMRVSKEGLGLIKSFEGFRAEAAQLADGRWTVGYGHTASAREGAKITESDAEALLLFDLRPVEESLNLDVFAPFGQKQFDALASLALNIGLDAFMRSDIVRHLNAGEIIAAANSFDAWRRARVNGRSVVVDSLVRRRATEKAMFLDHPAGRAAAPTPVLKPELDIAGAIMANRDVGVDVTVPLDGYLAIANTEAGALETMDAGNTARTPAAAAAAVVARLNKIMHTGELAAEAITQAPRILQDDLASTLPEINDADIETMRETLASLPEASQSLSPICLEANLVSPVEIETRGPVGVANDTASVAQSLLDPELDIGRLTAEPDRAVPFGQRDRSEMPNSADADLPPFEPEQYDEPPGQKAPNRFLAALPYGLFGLLGAAFIALGGWQYWTLVQSGRVVGQNELLPGPFLVLVGIIGLVIGTYYFIKRLVSDEA